MTDLRHRHPEVGDNEVLIGNYVSHTYKDILYKTKRKGTRAYDIDGLDITHMGLFPVFVEESEAIKNGVVVDENRNINDNVHGLVYGPYGWELYVSRKGSSNNRKVYLCDRYGNENVLNTKLVYFNTMDYIREVTDWLNENKQKLNPEKLTIVDNISQYDETTDTFKINVPWFKE